MVKSGGSSSRRKSGGSSSISSGGGGGASRSSSSSSSRVSNSNSSVNVDSKACPPTKRGKSMRGFRSLFSGSEGKGAKKAKRKLGSNEFVIPIALYRQANARYTLVYSHGNATDIGAMHDRCAGISRALGVNVIAYDYTGYGVSG